jgi:hypothetical protein
MMSRVFLVERKNRKVTIKKKNARLFPYPGRWTPWTELAKVAAFGDEQALEKRFGSVPAF